MALLVGSIFQICELVVRTACIDAFSGEFICVRESWWALLDTHIVGALREPSRWTELDTFTISFISIIIIWTFSDTFISSFVSVRPRLTQSRACFGYFSIIGVPVTAISFAFSSSIICVIIRWTCSYTSVGGIISELTVWNWAHFNTFPVIWFGE